MFRGRFRGGSGLSNSTRKPDVRGHFIDGVWHCDCNPRLPAEHFQVKNGGKNHGRWFYTCQQPQPKRCKFFLWDDDAKQREKNVVLRNSRSEPGSVAATPTKLNPQRAAQPSTPELPQPDLYETPSRRSNASSDRTLDHEESFDWRSSDEDELAYAQSTMLGLSPETPQKAAKTVPFSSPGKRSHREMNADGAIDSLISTGDVFTTPQKARLGKGGLLSPEDTPAPMRLTDHSPKKDLQSEVFETLSTLSLDHDVKRRLMDILSKHELRTQGIAKGREISRLAIKAKEKQIVELHARIAGLEAEKETNKMVIATLKKDLSTSPRKKPG